MADRLSQMFEAIERADALRKDRIQAHKALYTENDAKRLASAYTMYPWVNPQVLVSTVLSGNDDALPMIAEYAATKMAEAGSSPKEMARKNDLQQKFSERMLYETYKQDPSGNENMNMVGRA